MSVTSGLRERGWLPFSGSGTQITHMIASTLSSTDPETVLNLLQFVPVHMPGYTSTIMETTWITQDSVLQIPAVKLSGIVRLAEALMALIFLLKHLLRMELGEAMVEKRNAEFITKSKTMWRQFLT